MTAEVNHEDLSDDVARSIGLTTDDLFNLIVRDTSPGGVTESFRNVTLKGDSTRQVGTYVGANSSLVKVVEVPESLSGATVQDEFSTGLAELRTTLDEKKDALYALPSTATDDERKTAVDAVKAAQAAIDTAVLEQRDSVSDGEVLHRESFTKDRVNKTGLYALEQADLFNLLSSRPTAAIRTSMRRCLRTPPSTARSAGRCCWWTRPAAGPTRSRPQGLSNDNPSVPAAGTRRCSSRGCARPIRCTTESGRELRAVRRGRRRVRADRHGARRLEGARRPRRRRWSACPG